MAVVVAAAEATAAEAVAAAGATVTLAAAAVAVAEKPVLGCKLVETLASGVKFTSVRNSECPEEVLIEASHLLCNKGTSKTKGTIVFCTGTYPGSWDALGIKHQAPPS